jgi:hypothetical protein
MSAPRITQVRAPSSAPTDPQKETPMTTPKRALVLALSPADPASVAFQRRSVASSRQRRRSEVLRGNARAFSHGIMAIVNNSADTATEVALTFASHPDLDGIADLRLVETYALASVQYRRAIAAIDAQGITPVLTAYSSRLAALVERLERAVHDREKERIAQMRRGESMVIQLQAKRV